MSKTRVQSGDFARLSLAGEITLCTERMIRFAFGLALILRTHSTALYSVYLLTDTLPALIVPVAIGPFLDRYSKKRFICFLNLVLIGIYILMAFVSFRSEVMNYPVLLLFCLISGTVRCAYEAAQESFLPMMMEKEYYRKGYSILGILEIATYLTLPVSVILYYKIGIGVICASGALLSAVAFVIAHRIKKIGITQDDVLDRKQSYTENMKDGMQYLLSEKGLLSIQMFLFIKCIAAGARQTAELPYFSKNFNQGEWVYMQMWLFAMIGRILGNVFQYKKGIVPSRKFSRAFSIYIVLSLLGGSYLFAQKNMMQGMCFLMGFLGAQSYNMRISAVQQYVGDEKRGRFQGISQFMETAGILIGQLLLGSMTMFFAERTVVAVLMGAALAAVVIVFRRGEVRKIYNGSNILEQNKQ